MADVRSPLILVIDSDAALLEGITDILALEGYSVIGASNGQSGLEKAQKHHPSLVICDIMLPELDGYGVLQGLRSDPETAAIPFIFLTRRSARDDVRQGMVLGADDYLTKPFTAEDILTSVQSRLSRYEAYKKALRSEKDFDVFLSYSRRDLAVMEQLKTGLNAAGLRTWTDESLEPGTAEWERSIVEAIKYSACMVAILSPEAEQSKWVAREIAVAETLAVTIFPVLVRGMEQDAIPFRLMTHQWIDARQDYAGAFDKLLGAVKKHLGMS